MQTKPIVIEFRGKDLCISKCARRRLEEIRGGPISCEMVGPTFKRLLDEGTDEIIPQLEVDQKLIAHKAEPAQFVKNGHVRFVITKNRTSPSQLALVTVEDVRRLDRLKTALGRS